MRKIGLLSDTHSYYHHRINDFFMEVDEIWHAGDIGNIKIYEQLRAFKPLKAVYGNIDGSELRMVLNETEIFMCEEVKVLLTHIGGYPKKYAKGMKQCIIDNNIQLFICGHSHILKVINDTDLKLLHMNPGSAGLHGIHQRITMLRFTISGSRIDDLEVFDSPRQIN